LLLLLLLLLPLLLRGRVCAESLVSFVSQRLASSSGDGGRCSSSLAQACLNRNMLHPVAKHY
jgi:hypothetical protein